MSRRGGGRASQQAGDNHEAWVEAQHEQARLLRIMGHCEHNQASSKVVRGRLIFAGKGVSDYTAIVAALPGGPGAYLALEAKSTQEDHLEEAEIRPRQVAHLAAVARARGYAFLAIEYRHADGRCYRYVVPWTDVPWTRMRTARRVYERDLATWLVSGTCYLERYVVSRLPVVALPWQDRSGAKQRVYPRE